MTETVTGVPARNYIGGEWHESAGGATYEKRSPWRPSDVTGVYPASTADDARAAIEAAGEAFPAWSALPAGQRAVFFAKAAAAIEARAEQVAQDMTAEMGKPLREARLEQLVVLRSASVHAARRCETGGEREACAREAPPPPGSGCRATGGRAAAYRCRLHRSSSVLGGA